MVTAEEQGLLGSKYYAVTPALSAGKDAGQHQHRRRQPVGTDERHHRHRPRRVGSRRLSARRGRRTGPHAAAGSGSRRRASTTGPTTSISRSRAFRRSTPTPASSSSASLPEYSQQKRDEYTKKDYHKPSDEIKAGLGSLGCGGGLRAAAGAVGYRVANADKFPEWKPGNEFRAKRDAMMKR